MRLIQDTAFERDDVSGALIVVDPEKFLQDCTVEALRCVFPRMNIVGLSSEAEFDHLAVTTSGSDRVVVVLRSRWEVASPELTRQIKSLVRTLPQASLVLIARFHDIATIEAAAALGASGLIPDTATLKVATAAIQLVIAGGTCYPGPLLHPPTCSSTDSQASASAEGASPLTAGSPHSVEPPPTWSSSESQTFASAESAVPLTAGSPRTVEHRQFTFSPRELEVLTALGKGRSNKRIAFDLRLSENTVKAYISQIMRKLRATNRTQAALFAQSIQAREERTH
jgi:two-component system, NarL family, nitrate/nitrite response regulator NarL